MTASTPRPSKRLRLDVQHEDSLPPFAWLKNEEDREKKAEFRKAGTYHVIVNPESFEHCEDYRTGGSPNSTTSKEPESDRWKPLCSDQSQNNSTEPSISDIHYSDDPDIVILKVFENVTSKLLPPSSITSKGRPSTISSLPISSSATVASPQEYPQFSYDDTPWMKMANKNGRDHPIIYYYKNFVYRHIAQVHRDSLGTSSETGALSAQDVFERQAANFVPVCPTTFPFMDHMACQIQMFQSKS